MKILLTNFLLLFFLVNVNQALVAQEKAKYGFELKHYLEVASPNEMVPLLVEGQEEVLPSIIEKYNGELRLQIGTLFSIDIPAKHVYNFSQEPSVFLIEFSTQEGRTMGDTMLIQTNIDSIINRASPLRADYTGEGVVIGFIDSGIELNHPDFQDSTGKTRVMYVWDQGVAYDPAQQALGYTYGVEWDSSAINAGLSSHDDKAIEFGHGSNVAGAAASNGLASGQFSGVAPKANIIAVASDFRKPNWLQTVAEAVDYIYKKADAMGMPCVINASVGTYVGSHDGKDIAARMIDALIKQKNGRAFVCAAGNAGTFSFHTQQQPQNDTNFTWFENNPAQFAGMGGFYFEVWSDTADFNNVLFSIGIDKENNGAYSFRGRSNFDGIQNRLNTIYQDSVTNAAGDLMAKIETYAELSQGRYKLEIAIENPDSSDYLYRFETTGSGKLDIWASYALFRHNDMRKNNLPSSSQFPPILNYVKPDSLQTMVSSFTCLPSAITVGNYVNRSTYIDVNGTQQRISVTPGQISVNSSLGPNRNNVMKPDLSSAGDYMFASGRLATIANAITSNPAKVSQDSLHYRNGGTSMASPTVAGAVALYLQMCPQANNTQIKTDLIASAKADQFAINLPNPKWGNGKMDGFQFLKRQVFTPSLQVSSTNLCFGDSLSLSTNTSYTDYSWNSGDTTNSIVTKSGGEYYSWVTNQLGCVSPTDTANISLHPLPSKPLVSQNGDVLSLSVNGTYLWYYNQQALPSETNAAILAQNSGNYHCIYTDTNGCSISTDTIPVIVTGIQDHKTNNTIQIAPNPSKGSFRLLNSQQVSLKGLEIYSVDGKLIWDRKNDLNRQQIQLNLSPISSGIYFLKILYQDGNDLKKIFIE